MDRETKSIKTPSGIELIIKTYLTTREYRCIEDVFLSSVKMNTSGTVDGGVPGSVVKLAEDELIKQAIVSVKGESENILETMLDMRKPDFDFVIAELNKIKDPEPNREDDQKKGV